MEIAQHKKRLVNSHLAIIQALVTQAKKEPDKLAESLDEMDGHISTIRQTAGIGVPPARPRTSPAA